MNFLTDFLIGLFKNLENKVIKEVETPDFTHIDNIHVEIERKIRKKYNKGWTKQLRKKPPTQIVIHGTGGGSSVKDFLIWMYEKGRKGYNKGISLFNYLIGTKGRTIEIINPEYYLKQSHSGKHAKFEISIELMNSSKGNTNPYTKEQYKSLFELIDFLMELYPSIIEIVSHRRNIIFFNKFTYKKYLKQCPGSKFEWFNLREHLTSKGYMYKYPRWDSILNIKKG